MFIRDRDWFVEHGGITNVMQQRVLGESACDTTERLEMQRPVANRLAVLASEAWRHDLLSEGQLAQILQIDRITLRMLLDDAASEGEVDDALELPE